MSPTEISYRYKGLTSILDLGIDYWWFDCHWGDVMPGITINGNTLDYMAWGQYIFQTTEQR